MNQPQKQRQRQDHQPDQREDAGKPKKPFEFKGYVIDNTVSTMSGSGVPVCTACGALVTSRTTNYHKQWHEALGH